MNKLTKKEQEAAANILLQFMFAESMEDVVSIWNDVFEQYNLREDPFTGTPCTFEEYIKSKAEYEKQIMIERYGHCDGV